MGFLDEIKNKMHLGGQQGYDQGYGQDDDYGYDDGYDGDAGYDDDDDVRKPKRPHRFF